MGRGIIFFLMFVTVDVVFGNVPSNCLHCICVVETGCRMPHSGSGPYSHCVMDVGSYSCGPYQIKQPYWQDARLKGGSLMGDWLKCTADWQCSASAVQGYMARYATSGRIGRNPTCEDFARIHNGGPNGFKNPATLSYWLKVKNCLGRQDTNVIEPLKSQLLEKEKNYTGNL